MADVTILEAISLLTKVSADNSKMLKSLQSSSGGEVKGGKEELVKKADPVIVTDFGKAAEKDLAKLGGEATKERERADKERNKNNNLLKLLGLAGASALAMKFLFDGEGFTGLVQGFQNAVKTVTTFASKAKGLVDDIGKKLGTFADDVGAKVGTIVDDVMAKTSQWAAKAKDGIKGAMDDIGKKLGSFGDDIARGVTKVITGASNMASRVTNAMAGSVDDVAKGSVRAAATKPSIFSRVVSGAKSIGGSALEGAKNIGSKAIETTKVVGSKVGGTVKQGASFVKNKVLAPVKTAIGAVKPFRLLKGLARSPLLAPVLESFFASKDIKDMIASNKAGEIDDATLNNLVGKRLIKALTGVLGGAGGAIIGSTLGSFIPVVGNIIGAVAGGVLGDVAGRAIGGFVADRMSEKTGELGEYALNTPLGVMMGADNKLAEEIQDGIITKDGKVIKPDAQDTLYAIKDGGPLFKALDKTPKMIGSLMDVEVDSRNLLREQNLLLKAILEKTGMAPTIIGSSNNNSKNFDQSGDLFRSLQSNY
jgi:hypothetical protein